MAIAIRESEEEIYRELRNGGLIDDDSSLDKAFDNLGELLPGASTDAVCEREAKALLFAIKRALRIGNKGQNDYCRLSNIVAAAIPDRDLPDEEEEGQFGQYVLTSRLREAIRLIYGSVQQHGGGLTKVAIQYESECASLKLTQANNQIQRTDLERLLGAASERWAQLLFGYCSLFFYIQVRDEEGDAGWECWDLFERGSHSIQRESEPGFLLTFRRNA